MSLIATERRWSLTTKLQKWLYHAAHDFDVVRLNPPQATYHINKQTGKRHAEVLDDPDWIFVGHIPKPTSGWGWFSYHLIHGLAMGYPLRSVIAYSLLHTDPDKNQVSNKKPNRIDLWLDNHDWVILHQLAERYKASSQRVVESALAQFSLTDTAELTQPEDYQQTARIPIRLDGLAREQLEMLIRETNLSRLDILRLALQQMNRRVAV